MDLEAIHARCRDLTEAFEAERKAVGMSRQASAVEELRIKYLGRKGSVTELVGLIAAVPAELRRDAGRAINDAKKLVEGGIAELSAQAETWLLHARLAGAPLDTTLPTNPATGSLHPVTIMQMLLVKEFHRMGFSVYDGPEIESDYYNFASLNFPDDHPARDMQDTFYVQSNPKMILRTHTSAVQVHAMLNEPPPLKILSLGRVYRHDSDMTHTPLFHQMEALVVDENISFADLKGSIQVLLRSIFGPELKTRFRPSFFPFVEPGAEVDLGCHRCQSQGCRVCKGTGWLEVGGCGMVHPNVFEAVGIDSERFTGYAFGFGLDRLAMLRFGLSDLRQLFESDAPFLQQFPTFQ